MPPGGLHPRMVAWEVPGGSSSPSGLPQSFIFPRRLPSTPGVPWFHSEELTWNSPPPPVPASRGLFSGASLQRSHCWSTCQGLCALFSVGGTRCQNPH